MIKKFARYYKPYLLPFGLDLFAALVVACCNLLLPMFTRKILNEYIEDQNLRTVLLIAGGMLICYLIKVAMNYYMAYEGHIMAAQMQADMRHDLFSKFERLPCKFYDENKTGELMSRMTNDLFDVSELAHHGPEDLFISAVQFGGAFIILININVLLTLICFVTLIPLILIVAYVRRRMSRASKQSRIEIAKLNAGLENSISGMRVTKAFNAKELEEDHFEQHNGAYVEARRDFCRAMGLFNSSMDFGTDFLNLAILVIGAVLIISMGTLESIDLVTFMLYISVFTTPIKKMVSFMEQYESGMTGFTRFEEIMEESEELDDEGATDAPTFKGEICFSHVRFSYDENQEILHDLSFHIQPGMTLALVGSSGGGKTTICHLLPRFYNIDSGEILIDGQNICSYTRSSLRSQIGIVQQDVFLFNASIYDNIAYGAPNASKEEVLQAAAYAKLDEYIASLPEGYNTIVGERGVKLSGGQKQRIAIARVFLKNPPILILDEATSALDNVTEHQIQESLQKLSKGRTTIVVAHRLSTVRNANRIMYIENGLVIEEGTHEELCALNGEYAKLIAASEHATTAEGLLHG